MRRVHALAGAAYGALALTDTVLAAGPPAVQRLRRATKPLLMPVLATRLASGSHGAPGAPGVGRALAAQACSGGGDVALLGEGRRPFLTGLGCFLAAHVAYTSAYRSRSSVPLLATPGRRRALAAAALAAAGTAVAAGRADRALALPVAAYGVTLAAMVTAAAAVDPERGRTPVLRGAALFLVSDSMLGARTFLLRNRTPLLDGLLDAAVMATYTAGQWWIAEGLAST